MNRKIQYLRNVIRGGEWAMFFKDIGWRVYKAFHELLFYVWEKSPPAKPVTLRTEFPTAEESLDTKVLWGAKYDNSTNKKFVDRIEEIIGRDSAVLDLGCAGGQMIYDFYRIGWRAVGLEGSDYPKRARTGAWKHLADTHLFTCDITKPFALSCQFNLITAWEVLEHIEERDLPQLFRNIDDHLLPGGYFIASTTSAPDIQGGVDLHRTKLSNAEWSARLSAFLEPVTLDLKWYQYVRYNLMEPSILTFRKRQ